MGREKSSLPDEKETTKQRVAAHEMLVKKYKGDLPLYWLCKDQAKGLDFVHQ